MPGAAPARARHGRGPWRRRSRSLPVGANPLRYAFCAPFCNHWPDTGWGWRLRQPRRISTAAKASRARHRGGQRVQRAIAERRAQHLGRRQPRGQGRHEDRFGGAQAARHPGHHRREAGAQQDAQHHRIGDFALQQHIHDGAHQHPRQPRRHALQGSHASPRQRHPHSHPRGRAPRGARADPRIGDGHRQQPHPQQPQHAAADFPARRHHDRAAGEQHAGHPSIADPVRHRREQRHPRGDGLAAAEPGIQAQARAQAAYQHAQVQVQRIAQHRHAQHLGPGQGMAGVAPAQQVHGRVRQVGRRHQGGGQQDRIARDPPHGLPDLRPVDRAAEIHQQGRRHCQHHPGQHLLDARPAMPGRAHKAGTVQAHNASPSRWPDSSSVRRRGLCAGSAPAHAGKRRRK